MSKSGILATHENQALVISGKNVKQSFIIHVEDEINLRLCRNAKSWKTYHQTAQISEHKRIISTQAIVPQLSKCLRFEAVWGVLTDQMI